MSQLNSPEEDHTKRSNQRTESFAFDRIRDALRGLRFGAVTIIVQDGIVVQVDRTEKLRLLR